MVPRDWSTELKDQAVRRFGQERAAAIAPAIAAAAIAISDVLAVPLDLTGDPPDTATGSAVPSALDSGG